MSSCDCCSGVEVLTPKSVENHPGLSDLAYRIGTHGSFMTSMLARLTSADFPALHDLTVRSTDDFAISLLDAWALVADVLTFYQERIATEGFLRTARERRSLVELGRLVGYTLRPGLAASGYLAFTLDPDPFDAVVMIPKGSRAQSVPGPGETAQAFETSADLAARPSWNRLEPRLSQPTIVAGDTGLLVFEGTTTGLSPNDPILVITSALGSHLAHRAQSVTPDPVTATTTVQLQGSATAPVDDQLEAVRAELARTLGDPNGTGAMAEKLKQTTLEPLAKALEAIPPVGLAQKADALAKLLRPLLAVLVENLALSRRLGSARLVAWLTPLHETVETALAEIESLVPPVVSALGIPAPVDTGIPGLEAVAEGLAAKPQIPLPRPRALERSAAELLGPASDSVPRLLASFDAKAARKLAPALARANVSKPSPVESVQAPRVHAVPFGATAAPQQVTNADGTVTSQEWPLTGTIALGIRVDLSPFGQPTQATVTISLGPDRESAVLQIEDTTVELTMFGTVRLEVTLGSSPQTAELVFTFADARVANSVRMVFAFGTPTRVAFDEPESFAFDLVGSQTQNRAVTGRRTAVTQFVMGSVTLTTLASFLDVQDEKMLAPEPRNVLALDAPYERIVPGSWALVERPGSAIGSLVTQVTAVETVVKDDYNLRMKVTQLTLADDWLRDDDFLLSDIRSTAVHVQSESLAVAEEPIEDDVFGSEIELGQLYSGLEVGRWIIVEGERTDIPGVTGIRDGELSMIAAVTHGADADLPGDRVHTTVRLVRPLANRYARATVTIWGNVAAATQGETRAEVLGSGDRAKAFQTFGLRQPPLTYLPAPNAIGAQSALEVRVDGVPWHEADSLLFLGPTDQRFTVLGDVDDRATLVFGNGVKGARLPTGIENVKAVYRNGIGKAGNVAAGRISQLQTRPLGVSGVVNPLDATGGADRDSEEQARRNTPAAIMALDRVVSVRDYQDFAQGRAGIGKARAVRLSNGTHEVVHLTIAGADGIEIDPDSELFFNLRQALADLGDARQPVAIATRELVLLVVSASFSAAPDYSWELVEPAVRAALHERFGFDRQNLAEDVVLSDVIATIARVRGVGHVDVDVLDKVERFRAPTHLAEPPQPRIVVEDTRFERVVEDVRPGDTLSSVAQRTRTTVDELLRLNDLVGLDLSGVSRLVVRQGIRPAQLAVLGPDLPETLILREVKP